MEEMDGCSPQLDTTFPASHHLRQCVGKQEALRHGRTVPGSEMSPETPNSKRKSGDTKSSTASKPVGDGCREREIGRHSCTRAHTSSQKELSDSETSE